jgi:hypothetical protein
MNALNIFQQQPRLAPFGPNTFFNTAALPTHQSHLSTGGVNHSALQLLGAMQQLQQGLMSFAGAPFVGGFQHQPGGFPAGGYAGGGFQVGGYQSGGYQSGYGGGNIQFGGFQTSGFAASGGFPFVPGFTPQSQGFPAIGGFPFVPGFTPQTQGFPAIGGFPFVPGFDSHPGGFSGGFPPFPNFGGGAPLAGGGASLADQAVLLQAGFSDSLIAGNIGIQTGGFASFGAAQGAALAGPFASPFFF